MDAYGNFLIPHLHASSFVDPSSNLDDSLGFFKKREYMKTMEAHRETLSEVIRIVEEIVQSTGPLALDIKRYLSNNINYSIFNHPAQDYFTVEWSISHWLRTLLLIDNY